MTPKVSVLMPTYHYGRFLGEAIESVLAQEFQDYEFIIIDDCSTDNTREVAGQYAGRHPQLRFEVNPANLGMVANWNRCLAAARGRYVKFLFGDDKFACSTALGALVSMLEADPSIVLAASGRMILDEQSHCIDRWARLGAAGRAPGKQTILRCLAWAENLIGEPSAVLFRRDKAERGFDPGFQQLVDLEMWFHLLEQGGLAYTPRPLCCFRVHSRQQTKFNAARQTAEREYTRLLMRYDLPWLWAESSAWQRFRIAHFLRRNARRARLQARTPLELRFRQSAAPQWRPVFWITGQVVDLSRRLWRSIGKRLRRWFPLAAPERQSKPSPPPS
jgi:glycosyltransferase involved in cell wall biosynthesis